MAINAKHLEHVIVKALGDLSDVTNGKIPYSEEAVDLLLLTAAHESKLGTYLMQINGPAVGIFQMEPATHKDHWNYILQRHWLHKAFSDLRLSCNDADSMEWDLRYATLMARVHYYRKPEKLPEADGTKEYLDNLGAYAKKHYNTVLGKATASKYTQDYYLYCGERVDF